MWIFKGRDHEVEIDSLRAEAAELQAKLDALRAAEYREQLRTSCMVTAAKASKKGATLSSEGSSGSRRGRDARLPIDSNVEQFSFEDGVVSEYEFEIGDMYDFTRLLSSQETCYAAERCIDSGSGGGTSHGGETLLQLCAEGDYAQEAPTFAEMLRLRASEAHLRSEVDNQVLTNSALIQALEDLQGEVRGLTSTLVRGRLEFERLDAWVARLSGLVVDRGTSLVTGIDRATDMIRESSASLMTAARSAAREPPPPRIVAHHATLKATSSEEAGASSSRREEAQQPQEAPVEVSEASSPAPVAADDAQVIELARITEELTDALEIAQENEEAARRDLALANARLARQQAQWAAEAAEWRSRLEEQERISSSERQRLQDIEARAARVELEYGLERALASKGRSLAWRHLEV